jgi:hypothetical protein
MLGIDDYLSLRGEGSFGTVEMECIPIPTPMSVSGEYSYATDGGVSPSVSSYEDFLQSPEWCPDFGGTASTDHRPCLCRPTRRGRFPVTYNGLVTQS